MLAKIALRDSLVCSALLRLVLSGLLCPRYSQEAL